MNESNLPEMHENGLVLRVRGGMAVVETIQTDACASCSAKGACHTMGGSKQRTVMALNQAGAVEGDQVQLALPRRGALGAGFLVYILPVAALIVGASLGQSLGPGWGWDPTNAAVVLGLGSLAACWLGLHWLSKRLAGRRELSVRVVRIIKKGQCDEVE